MMAVLEPFLDEPGTLRLASSGPDPVSWTLDGRPVGWTRDGEPLEVAAGAGAHQAWAEGPSAALAMARAEPVSGDSVAWVPAWSTRVPEPAGEPALPRWAVPIGLLCAAILVLRRSKAP